MLLAVAEHLLILTLPWSEGVSTTMVEAAVHTSAIGTIGWSTESTTNYIQCICISVIDIISIHHPPLHGNTFTGRSTVCITGGIVTSLHHSGMICDAIDTLSFSHGCFQCGWFG